MRENSDHLQDKLAVYQKALIITMMNCFVLLLTEGRRLVLFPAGTTARDPPSRFFDTPQVGFESVLDLSSGFVE